MLCSLQSPFLHFFFVCYFIITVSVAYMYDYCGKRQSTSVTQYIS